LPRIVSNADDIAFLLDAVDTHENGLTLCTGSPGAGAANDLPAIASRFSSRTHFVHLRNMIKDADGSFEKASHLGRDVDMVAVVKALLEELGRRKPNGDDDWRIPFRPDHGHELLDDCQRKASSGLSTDRPSARIGRTAWSHNCRGVAARGSNLTTVMMKPPP
jgi:mannonate dehydratase